MLHYACHFLLLVATATALTPTTNRNEWIRAELPTVYEHFTQDGITAGLEATAEGFKLSGKPLKIISGAIHYFRVPPSYWRDRLRKLRAAGANTVETYVPWNLHEPQPDIHDFGNGTDQFSPFLDLRRYLEIAQEEDLLVLFRPGPYICTEWEFGGFPSWLLQDPAMKVRQYYEPYLNRVDKYFRQLLTPLVDLQFAKGGPIIGLQIENEYGFFNPKDKRYLQFLVDLVKAIGFNETLLYTSDGVGDGGDSGTLLDQLLFTANFGSDPERNFDGLLAIQPNKPLMAMEYYPGWFDHWFEPHHTSDVDEFGRVLDVILGPKYNGSVNFYMFHGGTNFGFMAGANWDGNAPNYLPDTTSYDYDAPLSEAGDYTSKYFKAMEIIDRHEFPRLARPAMPAESVKLTYGDFQVKEYIGYEDILAQAPSFVTTDPSVDMESHGQSYGYIVIRSRVAANNASVYSAGPVKDFGFVIVDGKIEPNSFANASGNGRYWINSYREVALQSINQTGQHVVDLFIENCGRINFGSDVDFEQRKGLPNGNLTLDGKPVDNLEVYQLEFKSSWVQNLTGFEKTENLTQIQAPVIARFGFNLDGLEPFPDTFLSMNGWEKGIVFVNGFNLGRYWNVGPQNTLYLPGPLLQKGHNWVIIFEQLKAGTEVQFLNSPNLGR